MARKVTVKEKKPTLEIPKVVPSDKETSKKLSVRLRKDRADYGTEQDAINTGILLRHRVNQTAKSITIFKKHNAPQPVVDYQRGFLVGLKYSHGLLKPSQQRKKTGRMLTSSGKTKRQRRGSMV